jgi:ferredoxin-NADP reductase
VTSIAAVPKIVWRSAVVVDVVQETSDTITLVLDVPGWPGHRAGQHVDVRLTAEDGYQTERSYSIASPPEESHVALTIERLDDGEVSTYLCDDLRPGDNLELRGPIGGYFVWDVAMGGPLLLVAGGSGIVPLMAMLRHRERTGSDAETRLLLSARRPQDVLYAGELPGLVEPAITYTREPPAGWTGYARRVDAAMLADAGFEPELRPRVFVCGPTGFVERAADALVALGHRPAAVRAERVGATG